MKAKTIETDAAKIKRLEAENQRLKEHIKSMKAIHDQALKDYMLGLKEATAAKNAMNELIEEAQKSKARYEALMRDLIKAR